MFTKIWNYIVYGIFNKDLPVVHRRVKVGQVYRHFKGGLYIVKGLGVDPFTNEEKVYYSPIECLDNVYTRRLKEFLSITDMNKFPKATQPLRFMLLDDYNSVDKN